MKSRIKSFKDDIIKTKFYAMGFREGSEFQVIRQTLFGATLYVKIDGINVAIRKSEAKQINLE